MQDRVRILCEVHISVRAQHAVPALHGACDVPPLLRPHEEHIARLQIPLGEAGVAVPQRGPHARVLAIKLLQLAAQGFRRQDQVVVDAQPLQVGEQVEQKVDRDGAQRRIFELASMVARVAHREEDELLARRARGERCLHDAAQLEVAACKRQRRRVRARHCCVRLLLA